MDVKTMSTLRAGDVVINKVSGKSAKVASVSEGRANIAYVDPNDPEKVCELGVITEGNAICFRRIAKSDEPMPVPEAVLIDDGKLVVGGRGVKCGQLRFDNVLHAFPGYVLLRTVRDETGSFRIISYKPSSDSFHEMATIPTGSTVTYIPVGEGFLFYQERRVMREVALESGESENREYFAGAYMHSLLVENNELKMYASTVRNPVGTLIGKTVANDGIAETVVFASQEKVDPETGEITKEEANRVSVFRENSSHGCFIEDDMLYVIKGENPTAAENMYGITIRTDREIVYENPGHAPRVIRDADAVKAVADYPYLVSAQIKQYSFTLVFANDALDSAAVTVTSTRDARGTVTEVTTTPNGAVEPEE